MKHFYAICIVLLSGWAANAAAYEVVSPGQSKCLEAAANTAINEIKTGDFHLIRDGKAGYVAALVDLKSDERFELNLIVQPDRYHELILFRGSKQLLTLTASVWDDGTCKLVNVEFTKRNLVR